MSDGKDTTTNHTDDTGPNAAADALAGHIRAILDNPYTPREVGQGLFESIIHMGNDLDINLATEEVLPGALRAAISFERHVPPTFGPRVKGEAKRR